MPGHNEEIFSSKNYDYISEEQLKALPLEVIDVLIEKYQLTGFFKERFSKPESFNQLLDLVQTQTFDPSLHRILLNFFNDLFNADPIFATHAGQLKPLLKVKLADQDSLDKWSCSLDVNRLREIGDEINELIDLKRRYPELNYKQLLCLWVYEYLPKTNITKDETIATILKLADTFLKEKKYEAFALVISELADCVKNLDEVSKHRKLLHSLYQSFDSKPFLAKDINKEQREEIVKKLNTPLTILNLIKQAGFQKLRTNYCTAICALITTYLLIPHIVILHEQAGLTLQDLKNEFFRLIHVNTSKFNSSDVASDMINAFYQSDFYKNQIASKANASQHTIDGVIDFQNGQSFNDNIKTDSRYPRALSHRVVEIYQLHHLINIALINLLQNKTNNIFKIVPIFTGFSRPDLLQTVIPGQGYWLGKLHIVINLKEGLINAPEDFKIETSVVNNVPGFAFQPIPLPYQPNLINVATQESGDTKALQQEVEQCRKAIIEQTAPHIDRALTTLKQKIEGIDSHSEEARHTADTLLTDLKRVKNEYEEDLRHLKMTPYEAKSKYQKQCTNLINDAKEVFKAHAGWVEYFNNLLRSLVNAVLWVVTFGQVNTFFPYVGSVAFVSAVEEAENHFSLV